jgi:hypothetical protein
MVRFALLFVLTFVPAPLLAQVRSWDVTATGGVFAGHRPRTEGSGYQDTWFQNAVAGVILGRHLTPHLKVELEATTTSGGETFRERTIVVPGYPFPYPIGSEETTSVSSIATGVAWQFRDNEWVHPFLHAGLTADFDRLTVHTWEQFLYGTRQPAVPQERLVEERRDGPTVTRHLRAVLGGGTKLYFAPRVFVRTEGRWSFDRERHNLAFRLGLGMDF